MPGGSGHAVRWSGKAPEPLHPLDQAGTWQAAGPLAAHQRPAPGLFGTGVSGRPLFPRLAQGLRAGAGRVRGRRWAGGAEGEARMARGREEDGA